MFIRIEDKVINTDLIECVLPNTEAKGIVIWTIGGENGSCFAFENTTLDDFLRMVK